MRKPLLALCLLSCSPTWETSLSTASLSENADGTQTVRATVTSTGQEAWAKGVEYCVTVLWVGSSPQRRAAPAEGDCISRPGGASCDGSKSTCIEDNGAGLVCVTKILDFVTVCHENELPIGSTDIVSVASDVLLNDPANPVAAVLVQLSSQSGTANRGAQFVELTP